MTARRECSEASFNEILVANPQLDGHADLIWQLHTVYWRNRSLGHDGAVGALIRFARAWAARAGEPAIGQLRARARQSTPEPRS